MDLQTIERAIKRCIDISVRFGALEDEAPRGRPRHRPVRGRNRRNAAVARRPRVNTPATGLEAASACTTQPRRPSPLSICSFGARRSGWTVRDGRRRMKSRPTSAGQCRTTKRRGRCGARPPVEVRVTERRARTQLLRRLPPMRPQSHRHRISPYIALLGRRRTRHGPSGCGSAQ